MTTKLPTKKIHIMDSVDVLDRINILLFQPAPGHFTLDFTAKEEGKNFILDNDAKAELERKVTEICQQRQMSVGAGAIEKTRNFILEWAGRYIQKCHKVGLAIFEDIPDAVDDHYAHLRKLPQRLN